MVTYCNKEAGDPDQVYQDLINGGRSIAGCVRLARAGVAGLGLQTMLRPSKLLTLHHILLLQVHIQFRRSTSPQLSSVVQSTLNEV